MLIIKHQLYLWNVVELNYKNIISSAGNLPPAPCHCPCPICRMPSNRYYSRIMSSSFLPSFFVAYGFISAPLIAFLLNAFSTAMTNNFCAI